MDKKYHDSKLETNSNTMARIYSCSTTSSTTETPAYFVDTILRSIGVFAHYRVDGANKKYHHMKLEQGSILLYRKCITYRRNGWVQNPWVDIQHHRVQCECTVSTLHASCQNTGKSTAKTAMPIHQHNVFVEGQQVAKSA